MSPHQPTGLRGNESPAPRIIGLVVPSNNVVVEAEFARTLPAGVRAVATRVPNVRDEVGELEEMVDAVDDAVRLLSHSAPEVVAFACTAASLLHGVDWERGLRTRIAEVAGVPAVTTSGAVSAALHAAGAQRVAVATPYPRDIDDRVVAFLSQSGFTVVDILGLGFVAGADAAVCDSQAVERLVLSLDRRHADAIFVSCTNLPTLDLTDRLVERTGLPVITSNDATRRACLAELGVARERQTASARRDPSIPTR